MKRYSARDIAGLLVFLFGIGIVASACIINPWVPRLWQGDLILDKLDVLGSYFAWSLAIGAATLALGIWLPRGPSAIAALSLPFFIVSGLILGDRFLLVSFGLPLWKHDAELHYRQRPDAIRTIRKGTDRGKLVRINRYGHHDDDFEVAKPAGEFRGVLLGDSVTMGYGVTRRHTFSAYLETLLEENDSRHRTHQIINTAVHGYSTRQERTILEESLRFGPDFIALGFCMNDVTEPFVVDERHGGVGLDYHGVTQTGNRLRGYLMNETGIGRLLQDFQARSKRLDVEKMRESFNVKDMAGRERDDPSYLEPWKLVLAELDRVYAIAEENEIPIVLLIFPFDFQLLREDLRMPQAILLEHAQDRGVGVIDLTEVFRGAVYPDDELIGILRARGFSTEEIQRFHVFNQSQYFLDSDHLTPKGHQLVAERLYDYLVARDLVGG